MILTIITIPDVTGLDLREGDRRWLAILDGHHDAYTGRPSLVCVVWVSGFGLDRPAIRMGTPCNLRASPMLRFSFLTRRTCQFNEHMVAHCTCTPRRRGLPS